MILTEGCSFWDQRNTKETLSKCESFKIIFFPGRRPNHSGVAQKVGHCAPLQHPHTPGFKFLLWTQDPLPKAGILPQGALRRHIIGTG